MPIATIFICVNDLYYEHVHVLREAERKIYTIIENSLL